ncbi:hypothetical protein Tco_0744867 [Tanacetum coccineum]
MVAPNIYISSDSSEESVGYYAPRVILFGAIPTIILVIPEVPIVPADPIVAPNMGAVLVVLPTGVLDLVDYSSSSDSDPSKDSLPPAPDLPLVSPFLCSDDSEAGEFPLAPVVTLPMIRRRLVILVRHGKAIPFGRLYRTHLNGSRKLLTARKRVGPIPARRLAWRHVSHHSLDRHSSSDSSFSSLLSDHSLSGHTPPDTTNVDSSTPQRFVHRSLTRTPRRSEDFRRWRPSRKRCRPPTASIPSPTHVSRSIAPTPADLLPHRKRFRDSYSLEDRGEEHMEVDVVDADVDAYVGISDGVAAHTEDSIDTGVKIAASDVREDEEEFEAEASVADTREIVLDPLAIGNSSESSKGGILDLEDTIYDIVHYMLEEEFHQVRRDRDDTRRRLRRLESTMTITRSSMTPETIEELINRRVEEALSVHEATRASNALEGEN